MKNPLQSMLSPPARAVAALLALGLSAGLGGCAIVASVPESTTMPRSGVAYRLPKAVIPVELVEIGDSLSLRMLDPVRIGDPAQTYFLSTVDNPLSSDTVKVDVDPKTMLLKKVDAEGEDKTLQVLKDLIVARRAIGGLESGASSGETIVFSGVFDPDGAFDKGAQQANASMLERMGSVLRARLSVTRKRCSAPPSSAASAAAAPPKPPADACRQAEDLLTKGGNLGLRIDAALLGTQAPASGEAQTPSAVSVDCSGGLCYRALRAFLLTVTIGDLFERQEVKLLPNGGLPIALPLDRAAFVKVKHLVEFADDGALQKYEKTRPSSLAELASWPLQVYGAILTETSKLFASSTKAAEDRLAYERKLLELQKELVRISAERGKLGEPDPNDGGPGKGGKEMGTAGGREVLIALPIVGRPPSQPNLPAGGLDGSGNPNIPSLPGAAASSSGASK